MISAINMAQQTPQIQQAPAFKGLKREDLLSYTQKGNSKHNQVSFKEGCLPWTLGILGAIGTVGGIGAVIGTHIRSQGESVLTAAIDGAAAGIGGLGILALGAFVIAGIVALFSTEG